MISNAGVTNRVKVNYQEYHFIHTIRKVPATSRHGEERVENRIFRRLGVVGVIALALKSGHGTAGLPGKTRIGG